MIQPKRFVITLKKSKSKKRTALLVRWRTHNQREAERRGQVVRLSVADSRQNAPEKVISLNGLSTKVCCTFATKVPLSINHPPSKQAAIAWPLSNGKPVNLSLRKNRWIQLNSQRTTNVRWRMLMTNGDRIESTRKFCQLPEWHRCSNVLPFVRHEWLRL